MALTESRYRGRGRLEEVGEVGLIAHRTEHDTTVYKNWGTDFLSHVSKLVEASELSVSKHFQGLFGKNPW